MRFPTALLLSIITISVSSVAAAPFSVEPVALDNLAERDLDAIHPDVELERRNDFMGAPEALEERDLGEEDVVLALRGLDELHQDLMERAANGEDLSELERRFNWHKLGRIAKTGLNIANKLVARGEEAPEVELLERDLSGEELEELERRFNWHKLGRIAKTGLNIANKLVARGEEAPEVELLERDFTGEELEELERRFNWKKLGRIAKVGLKVASNLAFKREESPEAEIFARDFNGEELNERDFSGEELDERDFSGEELEELERRFNWKKLGRIAKVGLKVASNVAFKREEAPEAELFEREFFEEEDLE